METRYRAVPVAGEHCNPGPEDGIQMVDVRVSHGNTARQDWIPNPERTAVYTRSQCGRRRLYDRLNTGYNSTRHGRESMLVGFVKWDQPGTHQMTAPKPKPLDTKPDEPAASNTTTARGGGIVAEPVGDVGTTSHEPRAIVQQADIKRHIKEMAKEPRAIPPQMGNEPTEVFDQGRTYETHGSRIRKPITGRRLQSVRERGILHLVSSCTQCGVNWCTNYTVPTASPSRRPTGAPTRRTAPPRRYGPRDTWRYIAPTQSPTLPATPTTGPTLSPTILGRVEAPVHGYAMGTKLDEWGCQHVYHNYKREKSHYTGRIYAVEIPSIPSKEGSCRANSGDRTGYTIQNPAARTARAMGNITCNANARYLKFDVPRASCARNAGNFVFFGCARRMPCRASNRHYDWGQIWGSSCRGKSIMSYYYRCERGRRIQNVWFGRVVTFVTKCTYDLTQILRFHMSPGYRRPPTPRPKRPTAQACRRDPETQTPWQQACIDNDIWMNTTTRGQLPDCEFAVAVGRLNNYTSCDGTIIASMCPRACGQCTQGHGPVMRCVCRERRSEIANYTTMPVPERLLLRYGSSMVGRACEERILMNDTAKCSFGCNPGYEVHSATCRHIRCTCSNGIPKMGRHCPRHGDHHCASCSPGYSLQDGSDGAQCVASCSGHIHGGHWAEDCGDSRVAGTKWLWCNQGRTILYRETCVRHCGAHRNNASWTGPCPSEQWSGTKYYRCNNGVVHLWRDTCRRDRRGCGSHRHGHEWLATCGAGTDRSWTGYRYYRCANERITMYRNTCARSCDGRSHGSSWMGRCGDHTWSGQIYYRCTNGRSEDYRRTCVQNRRQCGGHLHNTTWSDGCGDDWSGVAYLRCNDGRATRYRSTCRRDRRSCGSHAHGSSWSERCEAPFTMGRRYYRCNNSERSQLTNTCRTGTPTSSPTSASFCTSLTVATRSTKNAWISGDYTLRWRRSFSIWVKKSDPRVQIVKTRTTRNRFEIRGPDSTLFEQSTDEGKPTTGDWNWVPVWRYGERGFTEPAVHITITCSSTRHPSQSPTPPVAVARRTKAATPPKTPGGGRLEIGRQAPPPIRQEVIIKHHMNPTPTPFWQYVILALLGITCAALCVSYLVLGYCFDGCCHKEYPVPYDDSELCTDDASEPQPKGAATEMVELAAETTPATKPEPEALRAGDRVVILDEPCRGECGVVEATNEAGHPDIRMDDGRLMCKYKTSVKRIPDEPVETERTEQGGEVESEIEWVDDSSTSLCDPEQQE